MSDGLPWESEGGNNGMDGSTCNCGVGDEGLPCECVRSTDWSV